MVHLHWNAPQQCGRKEFGDMDWLIIVNPHLLSTQEVQLQLQGIHNVVYLIMILVLGAAVNRDSIALFLVSNNSQYEPLQGGSFGQGE